MPKGVSGSAQHGTRSMYGYHGCRCEPCKDAAREHARNRVARPCSVDGCETPALGAMCSKHKTRVWRHGSVDSFVPVGDRSIPHGEASGAWAGDDVGYTGAHQRVARQRGRPTHCIECGECSPFRRYQWSLNWESKNLVTRGGLTFSTSVSDYDRLCVPCHKRRDLDHIAESK